MYKLIACDLDGTLLRKDKTISLKTKNLLQQITSKGIYFVPFTGRCYNELPSFLYDLPYIRYVSFANGVGIKDFKEDKEYGDNSITPSTALEILEFVNNYKVSPSLAINCKRYARKKDFSYLKRQALKSVLNNLTLLDDLKEYVSKCKLGVQKILLYLDDSSLKEFYIQELNDHFKNISVTSSGGNNIEINDIKANKGHSLIFLAKMLNISISDTLAFGDNENDIEMLKTAGLGITLENGSEQAKKIAKEITLSNDEDGVRIALEKHFKDLLN